MDGTPVGRRVFLGLLGLPEDEMRMFLRLRDGILHSEKIDPGAIDDFDKRAKVQQATGQEIYDYFGKLVDLTKNADTERQEIRDAKVFLASR